jgi:hypothetical protein
MHWVVSTRTPNPSRAAAVAVASGSDAGSARAADAAVSAAQLLRKNLRPMRMAASPRSNAATVTVAGREPGESDQGKAHPPKCGCEDHDVTSLSWPIGIGDVAVCEGAAPRASSRKRAHVVKSVDAQGPIDTT